MKYTEIEIDAIFEKNKKMAMLSLSSLPVANGRQPSFQGLNGWVYEQTLRSCLEEELMLLGMPYPIVEQYKIKGRAKADLLVGKTAVEIKAGGLFGDDSAKYKKYKKITENLNLSYLYITREESHEPYYRATKEVFGDLFCFFLNEESSWSRFVTAIISTNKIGPTT